MFLVYSAPAYFNLDEVFGLADSVRFLHTYSTATLITTRHMEDGNVKDGADYRGLGDLSQNISHHPTTEVLWKCLHKVSPLKKLGNNAHTPCLQIKLYKMGSFLLSVLTDFERSSSYFGGGGVGFGLKNK